MGRRSCRGRASADAIGTPFIDDLDELLAGDIDAVTVTTATSAHHAIMLRAAEAGKHIFTEKPWHRTVAEAEEIIDAADKAGIAVMVSLPWLYHGYPGDPGQAQRGAAWLTYCRIRLSCMMAPSRAGCRNASMTPKPPSVGHSAIWMPPGIPHAAVPRRRPSHSEATYALLTQRPVEDQAVVTPGYPRQRLRYRDRVLESRPVHHRDARHSGQPYESTGRRAPAADGGSDTWQSLGASGRSWTP